MTLATPARGREKEALPASVTSRVACPNCGCDLRGRTPAQQAEQARENALSTERVVRRERLASIAAAVAQFYELTFETLIARDQSFELSHARQVAMYMLYAADPSVRMSEIGHLLARHPSTVHHGVHRIAHLATKRPWLAEDLAVLGARLGIAA